MLRNIKTYKSYLLQQNYLKNKNLLGLENFSSSNIKTTLQLFKLIHLTLINKFLFLNLYQIVNAYVVFF